MMVFYFFDVDPACRNLMSETYFTEIHLKLSENSLNNENSKQEKLPLSLGSQMWINTNFVRHSSPSVFHKNIFFIPLMCFCISQCFDAAVKSKGLGKMKAKNAWKPFQVTLIDSKCFDGEGPNELFELCDDFFKSN